MPNNLIPVTISCYTETQEADDRLRDLGIEPDEPETEFRAGYVNVDHIFGFYPMREGGTSLEFYGNQRLIVKESVEEVHQRISNLKD